MNNRAFRDKEKDYPYLTFCLFKDDEELIYKNSTQEKDMRWLQYVYIFVQHTRNEKNNTLTPEEKEELNIQVENHISEKLEIYTPQITKHIPMLNDLLQKLQDEADEQKISVAYLAQKICVSYIIRNRLHKT